MAHHRIRKLTPNHFGNHHNRAWRWAALLAMAGLVSMAVLPGMASFGAKPAILAAHSNAALDKGRQAIRPL